MMSVSYTPLSQGQNDVDRNTPDTVHSSARTAPMAKTEIDDLDENAGTNKSTEGNSNTNVPHVVVTEPLHEEKSDDLDDIDGRSRNENNHINLGDLRTITPHSGIGRVPGFGLNFDTELGSIAGETIPDINVYQHKKTLAQGMMDLALFSANANQLRYVLDSYARHPYYWPSVICIVLSLGLQVAVGVGLIWNALYDVKNDDDLRFANKINNFTVIGIFLVVVLNVFICVFAVGEPTTIPPAPSI